MYIYIPLGSLDRIFLSNTWNMFEHPENIRTAGTCSKERCQTELRRPCVFEHLPGVHSIEYGNTHKHYVNI